MRTVLKTEICKEKCNAAALGAYNAAVGHTSNLNVGTGVFGEHEAWRVTEGKASNLGIYPKHLFTKEQALQAHAKHLKEQSEIANLVKEAENIYFSGGSTAFLKKEMVKRYKDPKTSKIQRLAMKEFASKYGITL